MIGPYHPLGGADAPALSPLSRIFGRADLGFANQEGSIFDLETFTGFPQAENGGGYPLQHRAQAADIRALGIGLVSKANNHATDWGQEGLVATLQSLRDAGVAEAGAGASEAEARAPVYIQTPKGLAALVDTASTFPPMAVAGTAVERRGQVSRPRPGISALHVREVRLVPPDQLAMLRAITGGSGGGAEVRIGDQVFRAASAPGTTWEMEPSDEGAVLAAIAEARRRARFVVFSIHAHETAGDVDPSPAVAYQPMVLHRADEAPSPTDPRPAGFEPVLFHAAIDAGADVVVRTGPHVLNGIEIYKGRPIFYSLGSLFFDFGGRRSYTAPSGDHMVFPEEEFETVIPVTTYRRGRAREIRLYPMVIEANGGPSSGVPHPADREHARRILQRLQSQSAAFGTRIAIEGEVGVVRIPS